MTKKLLILVALMLALAFMFVSCGESESPYEDEGNNDSYNDDSYDDDIDDDDDYEDGEDDYDDGDDETTDDGDDETTDDGDDETTDDGDDETTEDGDDETTEDGDDEITDDGDDEITEDGDDEITEDGDDEITEDGDDEITEDDNNGTSDTQQHTHSYGEWRVTTKATCTKDGVETRYCDSCDETQTREILATGHNHENWKNTSKATCVECGREYSYCTECGTKEYRDVEIDPDNHVGDDWTTVTEPTCIADGLEECICDCGEKLSKVIPTDGKHTFGDSTVNGNCTGCGYGATFILPETPITINYYSSGKLYKTCEIQKITIDGEYLGYSYGTYKITFLVESTYHSKGNSFSDSAWFGWKLYDEDGVVVGSGSGISDSIKVGEKTKEKISIYTSDSYSTYVEMGKTYTLELLNISY